MRKGIYKNQKDNTWYISTKLKVNGKYHTCTIRGFASKKEADGNYEYEVEKWKRLHHFYINDNSYESAKNDFLEYKSKYVRQESLRKDKTQFTSYWDIVFANQPLTSVFDTKRLKIIYDDLCSNQQMSSNKKSRVVYTFNDFTRFCYQTRRITNEMYEEIKIIFIPIKVPKNVLNEKRVIPQSDMDKFFEAIDHTNKDYVMFKLFAYTGTRISEYLGICIDCIDILNKKIKIARQLLTTGKLTTTLKTNNSYREIPINDEIATITSIYIENNNLKEGRLFRCSHTDFKRKLKEYEQKANIPLYSSHEFRHTKATLLGSKCENIADVIFCSKWLGHSQSMFLNTYCHLGENDIAKKFI